MIGFIVRRLAFGLSLVLFATTLTFFLVYRDPMTIARNILGENASQAQVEA